MNEFEEKFKSFDNRKLLKIVEESGKTLFDKQKECSL